MKIRRIVLDQVVVPARPNSINSPEVDHPLHKLRLEQSGYGLGVELDAEAIEHYRRSHWEKES